MTDRPFVLVGTARELGETACLYRLSPVWTLEAPQSRLPAGSGALRLSSTGAETCLELKAALPGWGDRLPILLLGQGLQLDAELLNLLNGLGSYILLTEALGRSTKRGNGSGLTVQELLSAMDCLLIASAGSGARDLLAVLPEYQREKITNLMDFSLHRDGAHAFAGRGGRPHRGSGLVFGQSRSLERSSLFEPDELTDYQDRGILIAHQVRQQHTWITKVCQ